MKRKIGWLILVFILVSSRSVRSDDGLGKVCEGEKCQPRPACFNVFCTYGKDDDGHYSKCEASAAFTHAVSGDGDEIFDNSTQSDNPTFEVQCDQTVVYNGPAHRYTDRLGTRIQGIPGPYPAVVLPVGALREMRHYSESSLEFKDQRLSGSCYIYTGPALY